MRVGLIGCGNIGRLRAEAVQRAKGFELKAVADLAPQSAEKLAERFAARPVRSWQELIRREDIDLVLVSTPPSAHAEPTIAALERGKHVLCEKPLARSTEECRSMNQAAREHSRTLATGFNYRFYPSVRKARQLLGQGRIGQLDHIRAYTGYSAQAHSQDWMRSPDVMGGGALRDNGIHLIDLVCYFLGDVQQVQGFTTSRVWGFAGCEDNGFALLRSSQGVVASLQASWTEWRGYRLRLELYGSHGCLRLWCFPMLTHVQWSSETGGRTRQKWSVFPMVHVWEKLRSYRWIVTQSFIAELAACQAAVAGKPAELATGTDGERAVAIAEAASRNASGTELSGRDASLGCGPAVPGADTAHESAPSSLGN